MNEEIEFKLGDYLFPVAETPVYIEDPVDRNIKAADSYRSIMREDNSKLISIVKDSYKLVPNIEVIKPLMEQLHELDNKWYIDPSHSFVMDNRMRLQVTFPELTFNDGRSDIALSLFIHNSYDGSEGVRMYFGAIRFICSNGMIFGKILGEFYRKHTVNFNLDNLKTEIEAAYRKVPVLQHRIELLQNLKVNHVMTQKVEDKLGKGIAKHISEQKFPENQWKLYNYITWYISHVIQQKMRAQYQQAVSKLFAL